MNALVSAGGGTRAGAYARLWQGAGACRLGRVGGGLSFPVCEIRERFIKEQSNPHAVN